MKIPETDAEELDTAAQVALEDTGQLPPRCRQCKMRYSHKMDCSERWQND